MKARVTCRENRVDKAKVKASPTELFKKEGPERAFHAKPKPWNFISNNNNNINEFYKKKKKKKKKKTDFLLKFTRCKPERLAEVERRLGKGG